MFQLNVLKKNNKRKSNVNKGKSNVIIEPDGKDDRVKGGILLDQFTFEGVTYYKDMYNCIWDGSMNPVGIIEICKKNKLDTYIYHFIKNPYSEGVINVCQMDTLVDMGLFYKITIDNNVFYKDKNGNMWDKYGVCC